MPRTPLDELPEFQTIVNGYFPSALHGRPERHRAYIEELRPYSQGAEVAAQAVDRLIVRPVSEQHRARFVCFLDRSKPFTKTPESIDEKIFRYLSQRGVGGQKPQAAILERLAQGRGQQDCFLRMFFRDLPDVMNDIGRFRIVCNLLGDVQAVTQGFNNGALAAARINVSPHIEDRVEADRWEEGGSGHRAVHLRLEVPLADRAVHVEVQILSIFEWGWDVKSHVLYERVRRDADGEIDKRTRLKVRAASDQLYLADVLFEELYGGIFAEGERS